MIAPLACHDAAMLASGTTDGGRDLFGGSSAAKVAERLHQLISRSTPSIWSASAAGLSQRIRWTRGNRIATPDLWRVE